MHGAAALLLSTKPGNVSRQLFRNLTEKGGFRSNGATAGEQIQPQRSQRRSLCG